MAAGAAAKGARSATQAESVMIERSRVSGEPQTTKRLPIRFCGAVAAMEALANLSWPRASTRSLVMSPRFSVFSRGLRARLPDAPLWEDPYVAGDCFRLAVPPPDFAEVRLAVPPPDFAEVRLAVLFPESPVDALEESDWERPRTAATPIAVAAAAANGVLPTAIAAPLTPLATPVMTVAAPFTTVPAPFATSVTSFIGDLGILRYLLDSRRGFIGTLTCPLASNGEPLLGLETRWIAVA
jgi:hypothetical protein